MLKYLTKITMDILPSVVATIIGAYIVNHYIAAKPAADAPVAAAVAPAAPKKPDTAVADVGSAPTAGVRAKGISEKAILEKTASEKPAVVEKPVEKPAVAEKPAEPAEIETASISPDARRHPVAPREKDKTPVRVIPLTAAAQPAAASAPTVEAAITPEDHRDANDLARAAIERLRGSNEGAPKAQDAVRAPDPAPRIASVPPAPAPLVPAIRPLPPPIVVSTPATESVGMAQPNPMQPNPMTAQANDPRRPIPPADIPPPAPVDLRTDKPHTNVAEDMLLAAKSMFHSVIPQ